MSASGAVLSPAGSPALAIAEIGWVMIVGATLLFVATMALLAWAVGLWDAGRRGSEAGSDPWRRDAGRTWILGGGVALPLVVLVALFLYAHFRTRVRRGGDRPAADRQRHRPRLVVGAALPRSGERPARSFSPTRSTCRPGAVSCSA